MVFRGAEEEFDFYLEEEELPVPTFKLEEEETKT